ncbi:MAG: hypothetical protein F9K37_00415 [Bacteroidales bacterium]|nr:MAG: hypothetical protein F9K37_00415 [Bacteroidales bacterium]
MKRVKFFLMLLIVLGSIVRLNAQTDDFSQFQWLIGNWKGTQGDGVFYETWTKINENTLEGKGFHVVKTDTLFREQLQLHKVGKYWIYIASIENSYPVLFTLINSDDEKWIFVNYEHDFPQRIVYTKREDGKLHARVEGEMEGVQMKEEYLLEKY